MKRDDQETQSETHTGEKQSKLQLNIFVRI